MNMHELSIAMSIVEVAQEEAERQGGAHVEAVHLRVGLLSGVAKEALLSCYEVACQATPLEGSQLLIEEVGVQVFCARCNATRPLESIQWFRCPECGTPTGTIVRGRELEIVALEVSE